MTGGPELPFGVLPPGEHFPAAAPDRVGGFAARRDPFHARERVSFELHAARERTAGDGGAGVGFPVALFFFAARLFGPEVTVLVFPPGEHFPVGEQGEVAHPAGGQLDDVFQPRNLGRFVTRAGILFARQGGPFEALFAVAALAEFRGSPRPHAAVVAQRGGVGVGHRHFPDAFQVDHRSGPVLGLEAVAVAELGLGVRTPRGERAVAEQRHGELEPRLDRTDVGEPEDLVG